jgi:hypothetical protein
MLDSFTELTGVSALRLEGSSLQSTLAIDHEGGVATISLGFGEPELVEALLEARTRLAPTAPEPTPTTPSVPTEQPADSTQTELAAVEPPAPPEASPNELHEARAQLVTLLEARRRGASPGLSLASSDVLNALLHAHQPTASRRLLSTVERALDRGDRAEALRVLGSTSHWAPRLVYGALLLESDQHEEALSILAKVDESECPPEPFVTLLEHASRRAGADSHLARALQLRRRDLVDRVARRLVEAELRAVVLRLAEARAAQRTGPSESKRTSQRGPRASSPSTPASSNPTRKRARSRGARPETPKKGSPTKVSSKKVSSNGTPNDQLAPTPSEARVLSAQERSAREGAQRTFIMVIACIAGALTYILFRGR